MSQPGRTRFALFADCRRTVRIQFQTSRPQRISRNNATIGSNNGPHMFHRHSQRLGCGGGTSGCHHQLETRNADFTDRPQKMCPAFQRKISLPRWKIRARVVIEKIRVEHTRIPLNSMLGSPELRATIFREI